MKETIPIPQKLLITVEKSVIYGILYALTMHFSLQKGNFVNKTNWLIF